MWMIDIARVLHDGLGGAGARVPLRIMPNALVRLIAIFQPRLRMFRHDLGQRREVDHGKATRILNYQPRPAAETLLDCARSLLANA